MTGTDSNEKGGRKRKYEHASAVTQAGFTPLPNAVLRDRSLPALARLAYATLKDYAWQGVEPEIAEFAADLGVTEKTLRKALASLQAAGLVETKRRGLGLTNTYTINDPEIPNLLGRDSLTVEGARPQPSMPERLEEDKPTGEGEPAAKTARPRDVLFDALAVACDLRLDVLTREQARVCGVATAELRLVGALPEDVAPAVKRYRTRYPGAAATPKAIANHWAEIAPPARAAPPCEECGVGGGQHTADCPKVAA